jgi:hypothetical protein
MADPERDRAGGQGRRSRCHGEIHSRVILHNEEQSLALLVIKIHLNCDGQVSNFSTLRLSHCTVYSVISKLNNGQTWTGNEQAQSDDSKTL